MKNRITFGLILLSLSCISLAQDKPQRTYSYRSNTLKTQPQKADVYQVVPHLSANNVWKSEIVIRNNSLNGTVITFDFYGEDGLPAVVQFTDSDGNFWSNQGFVADILGLEVFSMSFESVDELNSFHIYAFADENASDYTIEAFYHSFTGTTKLATVGVLTQEPGTNPVMNLDNRFDIDSGRRRFRGLAVTNFLDTQCECDIWVYDDGSNGANANEGPFSAGTLSIPPSGKWLGTTFQLIPDMETFLPRSFGFVELNCDNPVSMLGLTFEEGSAVVGSVPINYGTLNPFNIVKRQPPARTKKPEDQKSSVE